MIVGFLSTKTFTQSSDITVYQFNINDGLNHSTVPSLSIDSLNQIWIGTSQGLNLVVNNTIKSIEPKNPLLSLTNQTIRSIAIDHNQDILVGTELGAFRIKWPDILIQEKIPFELNDKMLRVYTFKNHTLYFSREGKLFIKNKKNQKFISINTKLPEGPNAAKPSGNQLFWISNNPTVIHLFNDITGKITQLPFPSDSSSCQLNSIEYFDEKIYIGCMDKIVVYNLKKKNWRNLEKVVQTLTTNNNNLIIKDIAHDAKGRLWVAVFGRGIYVFDDSENIVHNYTGTFYTKNFTPFNLERPTTVRIDAFGNAFVGTDGNGLIRIHPDIKKFHHILPSRIVGEKIKDNFITAIHVASNQHVLVGLLNTGIVEFDSQHQIIHIFNQIDDIKNLPSIYYVIRETSLEKYLIGTDVGLLQIQDKKMSIIPNSPKNVRFLEALNDSIYLLGTDEGLFQYRIEIGFQKIETQQIDQISLLNIIQPNLIILAERGDKPYLIEFGHKDTTIKPIAVSSPNFTSRPTFTSFLRTENSAWIGTNFGLLKLDGNYKQQKLYGKQDGLFAQHIYAIFADNSSNIWLSTDNGIFKYYFNNDTFHQFTPHDGVQSKEFNSGAWHQTKEGTIYFGGVNGFNYFHPKEIEMDLSVPLIALDRIKIGNTDTLQFPNPTTQHFTFKHNQNDLTFEIKCVGNTLPDKNKLFIKLEGIDKQYIDISKKHEIRYPFLPPGNYSLAAQAYNHDGIATEEKILIKFKIKPPFHQTVIFKTGMVVFLLSIAFLIFYLLYIRRLKLNQRAIEKQTEIEKLRLRISREIHDDIGCGLTQIAIISDQLNSNTEDAKDYFTKQKTLKLKELSTELIQSMSEIIWHINPENDTLEKLCIYLRIMLNKISEASEKDIEIEFPESLPEVQIKADVKRKLSMFVKEAVNNAIKHAEASQIMVRLKIRSNATITLQIADNGKGFDSTKLYAGNGLKNLQRSSQEMGFQIEISSEPNRGTTLTLDGDLKIITT